MTRPRSSVVLAAVAGLLFLAVVIGALLRMPEGGPHRIVHVTTDRSTP